MYGTVDIWSNRHMESFFGMTVHFVDHDFILRKRVVSFDILEGRHTAENIARKFCFNSLSLSQSVMFKFFLKVSFFLKGYVTEWLRT